MGVNNQEAQADTTAVPEESVNVESSIVGYITETMDNVVNTEEQSISLLLTIKQKLWVQKKNNEEENDVTVSGENW